MPNRHHLYAYPLVSLLNADKSFLIGLRAWNRRPFILSNAISTLAMSVLNGTGSTFSTNNY